MGVIRATGINIEPQSFFLTRDEEAQAISGLVSIGSSQRLGTNNCVLINLQVFSAKRSPKRFGGTSGQSLMCSEVTWLPGKSGGSSSIDFLRICPFNGLGLVPLICEHILPRVFRGWHQVSQRLSYYFWSTHISSTLLPQTEEYN